MPSDETKCGCGRTKSLHDEERCTFAYECGKDEQWTKETCTQKVKCDSYGEIEFSVDAGVRKPVS